MPAASDLDAAVAAGIITADQAAKIADIWVDGDQVTAPAPPPPPAPADTDAEAEVIRFVRGFQDIVLTIGVVILLLGVATLGGTYLRSYGGVLVGAPVAYALAVAFARRWRLLLPSMALAAGFTLFAGFGVADLATHGVGFWRIDQADELQALLYGTGAALVAATMFYASFRLPFALGLMAASALAVVFAALRVEFGVVDFRDIWAPVLLGFGLVTFAAAMAFDLSDPLRRTLRADNAFWLHIASAPMIVHAAITLLVNQPRTDLSISGAVLVVAVVTVLAAIAIVIDRRALFVSALGYLGLAVGELVRQTGLERSGHLAITLVVVGAVVVAVAAGWHGLRGALIGGLPRTGILLRLPPVRKPVS